MENEKKYLKRIKELKKQIRALEFELAERKESIEELKKYQESYSNYKEYYFNLQAVIKFHFISYKILIEYLQSLSGNDFKEIREIAVRIADMQEIEDTETAKMEEDENTGELPKYHPGMKTYSDYWNEIIEELKKRIERNKEISDLEMTSHQLNVSQRAVLDLKRKISDLEIYKKYSKPFLTLAEMKELIEKHRFIHSGNINWTAIAKETKCWKRGESAKQYAKRIGLI